MAIYHLSVKPVSRGGGRSATAASAYRAAELVHDETSGQTFDYTRKRGVEHAEIVLPTSAAQRDVNWARDREALWNAAERAENRSNSRVAREYEIALPHELTKAQRLALVRGFAGEIANRHGVAVDFAIHAPHREGDARNHHAHLLATTRVIEPGGLGEKATIEWSDTNRRKAQLEPARKEIEAIRERWAVLANEKLLEHGHEIRIDHRSLEAQGIEREPTTHLGPAVSSLERRGIETEVGKRLHREALEAAQRRLERAAELGKLEREARELTASIIDLSGNIQAAKRERDLMLARAPEPEGGRTPARSLEDLQREGRERWLAMRTEQQGKEKAPERAPEKSIEKTPEQGRSLDEERQQGIERWREYRRAQELEKGGGPNRSPEREGPEKDIEPGKERDGPEIE
jgi:ATP-dependent exoDNAse (exonuclease V) alpha subunit